MATMVSLVWRSCVAEQEEETRQANTWAVAAEGVYDHADYGTDVRVVHNSHGSDWRYQDKFTAVVFADGRTCVLEGSHHDMPFPKGTVIVIRRNGLGRYALEKK